MKSFDTLIEALEALKSDGYDHDFNLESEQLFCKALSKGFGPKEFHVTEFYRFEGDSNPDDNSILFAIEANDGTMGVLLDAYGAYSGGISEELMQALKTE